MCQKEITNENLLYIMVGGKVKKVQSVGHILSLKMHPNIY